MTPQNTTQELVGRVEELRRAVSHLVDPASRGCAIVGGPGVGKSFLARFALDELKRADVPFVSILATRSAATIPLGAVAPLLADAAEGVPAFGSAHAAFSERAQGGRLVIFVDDAHLLDDASAAVLLNASLDPSMTFLLTVRAGEPCPDAVSALWRNHGVEQIELGSLSVDAVQLLLESMLGDSVPMWVANHLTRLSSGQPLMLDELVRSAVANGRLVCADGAWELSRDPVVTRGLLEVVGQRIDALDIDQRELLTLIALCEPVPLGVVDALGRMAELQSLKKTGLVSSGDPARPDRQVATDDRWAFASNRVARVGHPAYAEVVLARADISQRRAHYVMAAKALEAVGDDPLRATLWWHWAGENLPSDRLLAAARHCYWTLDYDQSGELAGAAWRNEPSVLAGHLYAFTLRLDGRCEEAELLLGAADDLATDDRGRALIATARAENRVWGMGDSVGSEALCLAAEALIDDPECRAEVVAYRGLGALLGGEVDRTIALLEPLLDVETAGRRAFATAAWVAGFAMVNAGRVDDALVLATEAIPINESLVGGEPLAEPGIHQATTALAMITAGRFTEVAPMLTVGFDVSREISPKLGHPLVRFVCGRAALHQGRCDDATGFFLGAVAALTESRRALAASWCESGAALAAALQGSVERARTHLATSSDLASTDQRFNRSMYDEAQGWLAVAEGHDEKAREIFIQSAEAALDLGDRYGAARLLSSLARNGGADEACTRLEVFADSVQGELIDLYVAQAHALADPGVGGRLFEVAEDFEAHGCHLEAAELTATAARALRAEDRSDEAARATAHARDLLIKCQGARTPLVADLATIRALTARELEIARLAAGRLSSGEIADRLGIAVRTVDNHLHKIYAKLGVARRSELGHLIGGSPR